MKKSDQEKISKSIQLAASNMIRDFIWCDTIEGHEYWNKVFFALIRISENVKRPTSKRMQKL